MYITTYWAAFAAKNCLVYRKDIIKCLDIVYLDSVYLETRDTVKVGC